MKEAQTIEWKQSWRDEYLKWVYGFANAEGGVLGDAGRTYLQAHAARDKPP